MFIEEKTCDICIVGGGVIGLTLAYLLAKEKVSVTLIDKSDLGQEASWAGAGILPAGNPAKARSPIGKWRAQAVSFFPCFSAELKSLTGIDNGYWQCGGLELRASASQLEEHRLLNLAKVERGEGLMCEIVDAEKLKELEPNLSSTLPGGVYFPGIAQIRNPWHLKALIEACRIKGVNLLPHSPCDSIERVGERITGIRTPSGTFRAEKVVIAAGTWTTGLLANLGWQPAMKPIKGQIVLLHPEQKALNHILLVSHQYLVPRQDGRILIGSTEEDVGYDKNTTEEASTKLRSFAARLIPSLADAPIEKQWSGLRPGSSDGRPFLGLVPHYQNLFVAAGHFRAGLQHSIMTGIVMRDVLLNQPNNIDITPFKPDRTITKPIPWIAHAQ
ncbi:MAG TPA: glycine oxidase ThiO [Gemmatales bacterium]|nr:glycine oxidase ThiO [Gemmatales bacterium]